MSITLQATRPQSMGYDFGLVVIVAALLSLGVVMVYSASVAADATTLRLNFYHLLRHLAHLGIGAVLMLAFAFANLNHIQKLAKFLLLFSLGLLVAVLIPGIGVEVNGSLRWLNLGGLHFQPSELAKVAVVIYFADYFARKQNKLHTFQVGTLNVGLVVAIIVFLLFLEPDFGAAAVITITVATLMFVAGVKFWHYCAGVGTAVVALYSLVWLQPYRVKRIFSHSDPWADPFDGGFQLVQSLIAIGRGEWFGVGLGNSIQKLFYLPHASNDFLVAVIGEELGAAGIFFVLILFATLLWRAFVIAQRARAKHNHFAALLAEGIGLLLSLQAAVHIGVNTGMLPTKGLTLPLVSYGGSSLLNSMLAIGLLLCIDRSTKPKFRK